MAWCWWPCCAAQCQVGYTTAAPTDSNVTRDPRPAWNDAYHNGNVNGTTINTSVFGASANRPLNVLMLGTDWSGDPITLCAISASPAWTTAIQTFLSNGGVVIVVAEVSNSATCIDATEFTTLNTLVSDIGGASSFVATDVDFGVQANTNVQSHALTGSVTGIGVGGSCVIDESTADVILESNDLDGGDNPYTIISAEQISSAGWIICMGDANMFNTAASSGDISQFLDNLCAVL